MSDSQLELIMQQAVAAGTAILNGSTAAFKKVDRGYHPLPQGIDSTYKPALFVVRLAERVTKGVQSRENTIKECIFALQIVGSETAHPAIDKELILLKDLVEKAYSTAGAIALMPQIMYVGYDGSEFASMPQGTAIVAFRGTYVTKRTDPWI